MIKIRQRTATYMKQYFNIRPEVTETMFDVGIIREDVARRVIIRDDYYQHSRTKKKTELKIALAEKYAVSLSTIEKIITEGVDKFG